MTNSDPTADAEPTIQHVLRLLDPSRVHTRIDVPVDAAAAHVEVPQGVSLAPAVFNDLIAVTVKTIFAAALVPPRQLTAQQALSEGIFFLNQARGTPDASGYEMSLCEAQSRQHSDASWVVAVLADLIKRRERAAYTRWVLVSHLLSRDWAFQCCCVQAVLDQNRAILPQSILAFQPSQLVQALPSLLALCMTPRQVLDTSCDAGPFLPAARPSMPQNGNPA